LKLLKCLEVADVSEAYGLLSTMWCFHIYIKHALKYVIRGITKQKNSRWRRRRRCGVRDGDYDLGVEEEEDEEFFVFMLLKCYDYSPSNWWVYEKSNYNSRLWPSPAVIRESAIYLVYTEARFPVYRRKKQYWKYKKSNLCMMMRLAVA
jgi:hypothetical protein